jgi:PIF1-like helicase/Helicase
MLFIGRKKVFKSPLAQIPNSQCVAPKVRSNCPLRMILQNQFEYSLPRQVVWTDRTAHFQQNIRSYNNSFAFTFLGAKLDRTIADTMNAAGVYTFRIQGALHHSWRKTTICAGLSLWLGWGAITIPSCNSSQFGSRDPSVIDYHPPRCQSFGSVLAHSKRKNCRQSTITIRLTMLDPNETRLPSSLFDGKPTTSHLKGTLSFKIKMVDEQNADHYASEYLNTINMSSLPPHLLKLKVGAAIILLRNLSPSTGLCNGTRLRVVRISQRVIECEILASEHAGNMVFIPRIPLASSSTADLSFDFQRTQFPLQLAFAMTINKAQGKTLKHVGLCLTEPVFTYGQLYVTVSRVMDGAVEQELLCPSGAREYILIWN